jgi:hypothetical protein
MKLTRKSFLVAGAIVGTVLIASYYMAMQVAQRPGSPTPGQGCPIVN